ncbi:NAD(P)-binding protein [Xanthobacter autotrophicus]|uniref:NAD(P)-binding protein n=1 Tax=Xanthobacter autotrophicus TaxID=280 RepID=UPI001E624FC9|nr:NAD(P)-binding protein [Xanthobacter autotrophicus]UDQ90110.1 NAD(P)-binding protein [Xanthobacter autotrophicus]
MKNLPVAVIGAGPIGLAAAAHLINRGIPVKVYEAGDAVATNIRDWGHVHLFSPWRYNIDPVGRALLAGTAWHDPNGDTCPTGADLVADYLEPLSRVPAMASVIEFGARVTAIGRSGIDKISSRDRGQYPFVLTVVGRAGVRRDLARAVIDASGTWSSPNPLGGSGLPADGEATHAKRIAYGIPDVLGRDRSDYAGRTTLVFGAGHSAANVLLDLVALSLEAADTRAIWVTRGTDLSRVYGGGANDQLPGRADLGQCLKEQVESGQIGLITGFAAETIREEGDRLIVEGAAPSGRQTIGPADRIVVCTGQRPDLALTREVRVDLDPWLESVRALGPMIDPNLHSCGSVPPHGHREVSHPEPGFYTVGIKSYGRAPTFLMLTGYEQVRSVVAAIAGDMDAANDVRLVLPETGVCRANPSSAVISCDSGSPAMPPAISEVASAIEEKAGCCRPSASAPKPAPALNCCENAT